MLHGIIQDIKSLISLSTYSLDDLHPLILYNKFADLPFEYYSREDCFSILEDALEDKEFNYKKYSYTKPKKDTPYYIYYDYHFDDDFDDKNDISYPIDINSKSSPSCVTDNSNKQPLSASKIGLGLCTGGLSLLFTGIRKKRK